MKTKVLGLSLCIVVCLSAQGCLERKSARLGPNIVFNQSVSIGGGASDTVELLFVIDNSNSMRQEQQNLATQIPALVANLAEPPDRDADGEPDWNAVASMRIGIVTTDTGIGEATVRGSRCMPGGERGTLRGGVFSWAEGDDIDSFAAAIRAEVEGLGVVGCSFEQPLEAASLAIARSAETGFPSAEGLLAVVVVSDEDDCSIVDDYTFFSSIEAGAPNVHCARERDALTPLPTLLGELRGTRAPEQFIFAAITGVPRDLDADLSPASILELPAMQDAEFIDHGQPMPVPACEFTPEGAIESLGHAVPARRLVELGAMSPDSVITTICTQDFGPALTTLSERVGSKIGGVCLVRELPGGGAGIVPCQIEATLPPGVSCADVPGFEPAGVNEAGAEICLIDQVPGGEGDGFFYSATGTAERACPQLQITPSAQPPVGTSFDAECAAEILRYIGDDCARSNQCESRYCNPISRQCAPPQPVETEPEVDPLGS